MFFFNKDKTTNEPSLKKLDEGDFVNVLLNGKEFPGVVISTSGDGGLYAAYQKNLEMANT